MLPNEFRKEIYFKNKSSGSGCGHVSRLFFICCQHIFSISIIACFYDDATFYSLPILKKEHIRIIRFWVIPCKNACYWIFWVFTSLIPRSS